MTKKAQHPIDNEVLLGLDPGIANFGWAIYYTDDGFNSSGVIKTTKTLEDHQRMLQIVQELDIIVSKYEIDCVSIEQMMLHDTMPAIIRGYGARMCALVHLTQRGLLFQEYNPTTTKKTLLGTGVAEKDAMKTPILDWFRVPSKKVSEHEIDSYAQIAMYICENKIDCPAYRRIKIWKENQCKK